MKDILKVIKDNNMIVKGDIVGVGCSGGADSMALLHFLNANKDELGITVIAVNVDHSLRENSKNDSDFVKNYCVENNIRCLSTKLNIPKMCAELKLTEEQGAREGRYQFFRHLLKNKIVTKIALGHHVSDQAETILLNLFRGTGITGAKGMDFVREDVYIRPLLTTTKKEILAYNKENNVPSVEDETNQQNSANRNFLRNEVMPLIASRWPQFELSLCNFARACRVDDKYIESTINQSAVIKEDDSTCKIALSYLSYDKAVVYRLLRRAFREISVFSDIETKHLNIIINLGLEAENGSRISLPHSVSVLKEYGYIVITNKKINPYTLAVKPQKGKIDVPYFGVIEMNLTRKLDLGEYTHLIDYNKVPKNAIWRLRQEGDVFKKFGGGTKSLNDYFTDKKIPARYRSRLPILASGNEVLVIAGVEISDNVKVDKNTKSAWGINVAKFL